MTPESLKINLKGLVTEKKESHRHAHSAMHLNTVQNSAYRNKFEIAPSP